MYNNNKGNNKPENKDINTRGIQFYNKDSKSPATMLLGYWGDKISIKVHPALPVDKQTKDAYYDYDHNLSTALSLEKITALKTRIEEVIIPAMEAGEEKRTGIDISTNSVILVGTGVKATGEVSPYIAIFKDIDENLIPGQAIRYFFKSVSTVEDYDDEVGSFTKGSTHAQFNLFMMLLNKAIEELANATAHSIRSVDKFFRDKQMETINEIAGKLGIEVGTNKYKKNTGNVFATQKTSTVDPLASLPDAQFTEDDLPF